MTFEIELDGALRLVTLRRDGDHWVATTDGREVAVSVVEDGGRWSMLVGPPQPDAQAEGGHYASYDIAIESGGAGDLVVHVNGVAVRVTIVDRRSRGHRRVRDGGDETQPRTVVAPMPGRIVKVLVKPGETVQARQGLVVVEAMKMENELRAPRAGTVAEVRVTDGASVEANAVLVVLR